MLQKGPHPAPIFAHVMPNPAGASRGDVLVRRNNEFVAPAPPAATAPPVQRTAVSEEPTGAVVPMLPRARPPEAPPKIAPAATRPAALHQDPIGDMIKPPQAAHPPQSPSQAAAPAPRRSRADNASGLRAATALPHRRRLVRSHPRRLRRYSACWARLAIFRCRRMASWGRRRSAPSRSSSANDACRSPARSPTGWCVNLRSSRASRCSGRIAPRNIAALYFPPCA